MKRSHVAIWKWIRYMDINNFIADRRREKKRIRCIMIDYTMITIKGRILVMVILYMNLIQISIY
jgi:hypothetical protein